MGHSFVPDGKLLSYQSYIKEIKAFNSVRILTRCSRKWVTLKALHIPGRLSGLSSQRFQAICNRLHQSFCNKVQQQSGSICVTSTRTSGLVRAHSLPLEDLDPYAFLPIAVLGKVVEKLYDYPCRRIILIAPGWPNMSWFWDLVTMSSQIPLCLPNLPNLLTQPFNQTPHRNLSNLNLHAWFLESQQSTSKASLRQ